MTIILALGLIKIAPAFINQYYDECISQQLAAACCPFNWPTWVDVVFYLFN